MTGYFLMLSAGCGCVIALAAGVTAVTRGRLERKWRFILWIALALRMLLPFDISLPQPVLTLKTPEFNVSDEGKKADSVRLSNTSHTQTSSYREESATVHTNGSTFAAAGQTQTAQPHPAELQRGPLLDWSALWNALPWLWLAGALLSALWFMGGYMYHRRMLLRWSYLPQGGVLTSCFELIRRDLGVRTDVGLRICKKVSSPMMLGVIRPVLLMPEGRYTAKDLEYIFRHELLHVKRRDVWMKGLMLLVRTVHWFNPLTIVMSKGMSEDIEILCDAQVVKNLDSQGRREYNEVLLKYLASRNEAQPAFSTCFGGSLRKLKERFIQVAKGGRLKKGYLISAVLLSAVLLGSLLASCAKEQPKAEKEEESRREITETSRQDSVRSGQNSKKEESSRVKTDEEQLAAAYLYLMKDAQAEYEESALHNPDGNGGAWKGTIRLLDMDGDGTPELLISNPQPNAEKQSLYRYQDGRPILLWEADRESGSAMVSMLRRRDGRIYLEAGHEILSLQDGEIETVMRYDEEGLAEGYAQWNGETLSEAEFKRRFNEEWSGSQYDLLDAEELEELSRKTEQALQWTFSGGTLDIPDDEELWHAYQQYVIVSEQTPMAQEYIRIVDEIWEEYGEPEMRFVYDGVWQQSGAVRLLDFDGDGIPELYCSYGEQMGMPNEHVIYQYRDGQANLIWRERVTSKGTDVSPASWFYRKDGKVYLNWGEEAIGMFHNLWTYQDGQWSTILEYDSGFFRYDGLAVLNGKIVGQNEMRTAVNKELAGFEQYIIFYYYVTNPQELALTQQTVLALRSCAEGAELVLPDDSPFWSPVQPLAMVDEPEQTEEVKMAQQYLSVMYEIETQNQSIVYQDRNGGILTGVFRLLDFDGDGIDELYCSYNTDRQGGYPEKYPNRQVIYQYQNGSVVKIFEGAVTNRYDDPSPVTWLIEAGGKVYLRNSDGAAEKEGQYLTLQNGSMQSVFTYEFGEEICLLNGENVSADDLYKYINAFEAGGREQIICYDNSERDAENISYNTRFMLEGVAKWKEEYSVPDDSQFWTDCQPHTKQDQEEAPLPPEEQYRQIVRELTEKYGEGGKDPEGDLTGLFEVRLIDFDGDGADELYCAYSVFDVIYYVQDEEIYQIQNQKAVRVHRGGLYCSSPYQPQTTCLERDGKVYLRLDDYYGRSKCGYTYKTIINGKMEWVYYCDDDGYYINGGQVTEEQYEQSILEFTEGGTLWTFLCSGEDAYVYNDFQN